MNHTQVKEMLFKEDPKLKHEYDALAPKYELHKQVIQLRQDAFSVKKNLQR